MMNTAKMTENNFNHAIETEPGYGQIFAVLIRRRFWLIGVLCGALTIAIVITLKSDPIYKSSMRLLMQPNYQTKKEVAEGAVGKFTDSSVEIDYSTQINVMRSSVLMHKVVSLLRLKYPDITVDKVQKSLVLTPVLEDKANTKIIEAVYSDKDPVKTKTVLDILDRVYQNYNKEQQEQRLKKGLNFIDEQIPGAIKLVEQSDTKLEQFRQNHNLIDPEQQGIAITQALNKLEQEQQSIRAQIWDNQARYDQLQQQLARSPQKALTASRLSQSQRYQALLNELQKTELSLAQRRVVFTDSDPKIQELLQQRQSQRNLLQAEGGRVLGQSNQLNNTGEDLLTAGQFGAIDQNLTSQLLEMQTSLGSLKARNASLVQTEQQLRTQLNQIPILLAEYNRLQPLVQINRDQLQQLLTARQKLSLEITRGGFDLQTLEFPQLGEKIGPSLKLNLLLGLVVGLMLGSVAAFLREMIDDTLYTSDELKKQVALPLLGILPKLPNKKADELSVSLPFGKPKISAPWTIKVGNQSPSWRSLDLIYKNIQLLNSSSSFTSLTITSAVAGEGKTTLALGLALSAARLHQRVLLIDADLRRPHLHQKLKLPNQQGLSTLLTNDVSLPVKSSIQSSDSYIDVLTAGPMPDDPANLLSSPRMWELMALFEQSYDLVLVDASPILGMPDAILAASLCSGVVLVSRMGAVTRTELTQATAVLSQLNVIGVIANEVSGPSNGHSYTAYTKQREVVLPKRVREVAKSF